MTQIRARTMDGTETSLERAELDALALRMRGSVFTPDSAGYDAARTIWNAMIDRRPALIARCAGVADVVQAVAFAHRHRLLLAIRGGGHNIAGLGTCDGGLVVDLSAMRSVRVDPAKRRAHVEGGALLGDVDHETQAFGLATPLGINSTTGLAGLTLGGGFGWLTRLYGMTIDNLHAVDVVTADGRLVRASVDENPDLFWAVRGGGGNFGVATRFELALHPVGPEVLAGVLVFPGAQARQVLTGWRDLVASMPEQTSPWIVMRRAPPLPFLAPEVHGTAVVLMPICHAGEAAAGERALAALRALGTPIGEHVGLQPYETWQRTFDPLLAAGARNYWKSHNLATLPDAAIEPALDALARLPSPDCEVFLALVDGAASRRARDETAYAHRDARIVLNVHARWSRAEDDGACIGWARSLFDALAPHATGGVYVNFMTGDETARVPQAYHPDAWSRLAATKAVWDPENFFRTNQNIPPHAQAQRRASGNGEADRAR